jgi:hypothetical protein
MERTDTFEKQIQQWVAIDNQLKALNEKARELREKKQDLCETIMEHVQKNNLSNATVQISDGRLKFSNTRVPTPLTFKYLEKSLKEVIKNEEQAVKLIEYVKTKREFKVVPEIKRFSTN